MSSLLHPRSHDLWSIEVLLAQSINILHLRCIELLVSGIIPTPMRTSVMNCSRTRGLPLKVFLKSHLPNCGWDLCGLYSPRSPKQSLFSSFAAGLQSVKTPVLEVTLNPYWFCRDLLVFVQLLFTFVIPTSCRGWWPLPSVLPPAQRQILELYFRSLQMMHSHRTKLT